MESTGAHAAAPSAAQKVPATEPAGGAPRWNVLARISLRFLFAYFVLYSFPFPLYEIPGSGRLLNKYTQMWHAIEVWTGKHVLHLSYPITVFRNGSGDTTSDYLQVLCFFVLAATVCLIWSLLDRRRAGYPRLYLWLRLYVRLVLGATLVGYGAAKVIKTQFPPFFLSTLVEPYGESSPMGLLWSFMEYSAPYNVFTGAVEMLGGILLFVPRLATLGGLITAAAMTNVFMLNMSYDVPVKLFSFHLLAMSIFIVAPDLKRLAGFFILNRTVEAKVNPPLSSRVGLNRSILGLQLLLGLVFTATSLHRTFTLSKMYGSLAPKPPLYGIWSVEEFTMDGEARPPLLTDNVRWQRVIFDRFPGAVAMQKMSGERLYYPVDLDLPKKKLTLHRRADPKWIADFTIEQPQPDSLVLQGQIDGHQIYAKLHQQDEAKFLLLNRGFHWINEYPFNR